MRFLFAPLFSTYSLLLFDNMIQANNRAQHAYCRSKLTSVYLFPFAPTAKEVRVGIGGIGGSRDTRKMSTLWVFLG